MTSDDLAPAAWRYLVHGEWFVTNIRGAAEFRQSEGCVVEPLYTTLAQSDAEPSPLWTGAGEMPDDLQGWPDRSGQSDKEPQDKTDKWDREHAKRRVIIQDENGRFEAVDKAPSPEPQDVREQPLEPIKALLLRALERRRFVDEGGRYLLTQSQAFDAFTEVIVAFPALAQSNAEPVAWPDIDAAVEAGLAWRNPAPNAAPSSYSNTKTVTIGGPAFAQSDAEPKPDDNFERHLHARVSKLEHDIAIAIGSNRFLDPPDGGDVSLAEQVKRMRKALEAAEAQSDAEPIARARYHLQAADHALHEVEGDPFADEAHRLVHEAAFMITDEPELQALRTLPQDVEALVHKLADTAKRHLLWKGSLSAKEWSALKQNLALDLAILAHPDASAGHSNSLIKGERSGISWGSFYVEGDRKSIDAVRDAFNAKERCEALDRMIGEKQLVRPDASAELIATAEIYRMALERISKSNPHDMGTLHPDGCPRVAAEALRVAGRGGK